MMEILTPRLRLPSLVPLLPRGAPKIPLLMTNNYGRAVTAGRVHAGLLSWDVWDVYTRKRYLGGQSRDSRTDGLVIITHRCGSGAPRGLRRAGVVIVDRDIGFLWSWSGGSIYNLFWVSLRAPGTMSPVLKNHQGGTSEIHLLGLCTAIFATATSTSRAMREGGFHGIFTCLRYVKATHNNAAGEQERQNPDYSY